MFLCRFLEHLGWTLDREFSGAAFADGAGISTWAADCVDICTRAGLAPGRRRERLCTEAERKPHGGEHAADPLCDKTG